MGVGAALELGVVYDTNPGKLVLELVQMFKSVKLCFPETINRFKVSNIFILKVVGHPLLLLCQLKVASTNLDGVTVLSLSKTHLSLLSTGSTQA